MPVEVDVITDAAGTGAPDFTQGIEVAGVTDGSSATAGDLGEELVASVLRSALVTSYATTVPKNVTSLALTAGDWDVSAEIGFQFGGTPDVTQVFKSVSLTTNTLSAADTIAVPTAGELQLIELMVTTAAGDVTTEIAKYRLSISSTTTFFLVARADFIDGSVGCYGSLRARRIR